jgi:glycerophosphoryl diester phosphodiesterase
MIELDLHATRDGEVVVIHDDDLTVTTDLKGRVSSMTRAQVLCADAGDGERVPTLRETLDLARGRIQLYLEIKDAKAATGTVQLVREFQVEDEVLLASFDLELMRRVQAENRDLKIGLILGTETFGTLVRLREHFLWIALRGYQYQVLSLHLDLCRRKTITKAHESGKTAFAWTANDETTIRRLIDLGVDGIVTNYPDRMAGMVFRDSG